MQIILFIFTTLVSIITYTCVFISPEILWIAGIICFLIPFFLALNLVLTFYYILKRDKRYLVTSFVLLLGIPFINMTWALNLPKSASSHDFSILSYNVHSFLHSAEGVDGLSEDMLRWVVEDDAGIKCFQEFMSIDSAGVNTTEAIRRKNGYHYIANYSPKKNNTHGIAIFSKYRIINSGTVISNTYTHNGVIFADLTVAKDTIRVYNVHLKSMGLTNGIPPLETYDDVLVFFRRFKNKLKQGFIMRSYQVRRTMDHIENSPYPVIVCGDLNDVPYSYTYFKLRTQMANGFEQAGHGFGFTYNKTLPFLRIDNQFADDFFTFTKFSTGNVKYSDHYPIKGYYSITNKK